MKNKSNASLSLRKLMLSALVAAPLATLPVPLWALPATQTALNGTIVSTSSGVTVTSTSTTRVDVTSTATNSVIKWSDFGSGANLIGATDVINYALPTTSSSILNMVTGASPTVIDGQLISNGQLYVMNPNGITVSGTGKITASAVGLSSVPETEYNLLNTGNLLFVANQTTTSTTTAPVTVATGATITAASGTGNIYIAGQNVALNGTLDGGAVWVNAQNTGTVTLGATGALTVGDTVAKAGNLTVASAGSITIGANAVTVYGPAAKFTTTNAAISQTGTLTVGAGASADATVTANAGTSTVSFADARINGTGTLTVNATGASAGVSSGAGNLAVTGTTTGAYTVTSAGDLAINTLKSGSLTGTAAGNITASGNSPSSGAVSLTAGTGKNITFQGNATALTIAASSGSLGNVSITSTKDLALPSITAGNLTVTVTGNLTQSAAQNVTTNTNLTASGTATLSQTINTTNLWVTTTGSGKDITQNTGVVLNASGNATFSSAGNLTLDALTTPVITGTAAGFIKNNGALNNAAGVYTLTSTGGPVTLTGAVTTKDLSVTASGNITQGAVVTATGNVTLNSTAGAIDLSTSTNVLTGATLVVKNAPNNAKVTSSGAYTLGNGTAATGNVTLTSSGVVTLGAASADTISVVKALTIDTSGTAAIAVTGASNAITVGGALNVKTQGGAVTLASSANTANSFGTVNIDTTNGAAAGANATIYGNTTLTLGAITLGTGGDLTAYSRTAIANTGVLSLRNAKVGAGTATAPGAVALNFDNSAASSGATWNKITGTVTVLTDLELLNVASTGNYLASSLAVTNGITNAALVSIPANIYSAGLTGPVTITTVDGGATAADTTVGALVTTGAVTLTGATGFINATNAANTFTTVTLNSGTKSATTTAVSSKNALTVNGNVTSGSSGAVTFTSTDALTIGSYNSATTGATTFTATKALSDSVTGISVYADTNFNGSSVNITRSGHNFGKVGIATTGNGNATVVEGGTLNLGTIGTGSGSFSATSSNGDVIQSGVITTTGPVTVSAQNGIAKLDAVNVVGNATVAGLFSVTAKGNSTIKNSNSISLGTTAVSAGTLTVATTTAATDISQKAGSTVYAYGASSFTTTTTGNITLDQSGNQFGGLTLSTGSGNITAKESTTMNLKAVTTSGTFSATSENGSIIDSASGTTGIVGATGNATFTAPNGSITLTSTGNNFNTVSFTTGGNVAVYDINAIKLDTSVIGGTLDVTAAGTGAAGSITQGGALKVSGNTTLLLSDTAGATFITLNNTANEFGGVRFSVGTGGAILDENTTFNLRAGSFATGPVTINTAGNFVTSGPGGSSFTGSGLTIYATGTIIPSAGSLLVTGTLTVSSTATKDLSALSKSGNLNGKDPVNLGTGTYVAPSL